MDIAERCGRTGKRQYATRAKAEKVAHEMMRKHKHHDEPGHLHGYRCPCCCQFHVGHAPARRAA